MRRGHGYDRVFCGSWFWVICDMGGKHMAIMNDDNLDLEYLYAHCEKCGIKMPTEAQEDNFIDEVGVGMVLGLSLNTARIKAFTNVMVK